MDKDTIRNALTQYEMLALDQQNRIKHLRIQITRDIDTTSYANDFARMNEELYLKLKTLIYDVKGINANNPVEEFGTTDSFPARFEKINACTWKLHLPPFFSINVKDRYKNEGKHIYFLIINLLNEYEKEHGRIRKLEKPLVIFRHHICDKITRVFDYDNIDSKRAIDAMQGFFLSDDNALYLTTIHESVKDEEESYCDIYILDRADDVTAKKVYNSQNLR